MTVRFRIDELKLETTNGPVVYRLPGDLTVFIGQTGVGKTTLFELIKYGLGGDAVVAPVAEQHVSDVQVTVTVADRRFQLIRAVAPERRRVVRVVDTLAQERLPDHHVAGEGPTVSDLLLSAMGIESGLRAAARGSNSTSEGAYITFYDIYRFMYVPQSEMNHDIASSKDGYYDPKRKSVFELLFRITSSSVLQMRSQVNKLRSQLNEAAHEAEIVKKFLADSKVETRDHAMTKFTAAQNDESEGRQALAALSSELEEAVDRESQVLRDLLNDAERALAEGRDLAAELVCQRSDYSAERRRVSQEIDRLARMELAGMRLADIEFVMCPRCTQRLDRRNIPDGSCRVCLQDDIVAGVTTGQQPESEQLHNQLSEVEAQLQIIDRQQSEIDSVIEDRQGLVLSLTAEIDLRTKGRVTPRLQAYADAAAKVERAAADQRALSQVLWQWDRTDDLDAAVEILHRELVSVQSAIRAAEGELSKRKDELFKELDAEFQSTVTAFGIPSIETASISPSTYLPVMNGRPFDRVSAAGGIITATQVAYWMTLVTVSGRRWDTDYPGFLMLDSPRLALNAEEDIAAQMYRRFGTQVDAAPGRLQFVIADNDLPSGLPRNPVEEKFSYDEPTISTVAHPGPADVAVLVESE